MSPYRAVLLALFVVGGALVAAAPAGATAHDDGAASQVVAPTGDRVDLSDARPAPSATGAAAANNSTNSPLGTDISSFMQSNAAEVDGTVETGMWSAAFDGTENESVRSELVEMRTAELRERLTELRERRGELVAAREAGNVSETAYRAQMGRLLGDINALKSAIDVTTTSAQEVNASGGMSANVETNGNVEANANVEALAGLRAEAENLSGPEVAAVARNVTGVGNGERGPPNGVGNGNAVGAANDTVPGNGNAASAANGTMPGNGNAAGREKGMSGAGNGTVAGNGEGIGANGVTNASNRTAGPPDHVDNVTNGSRGPPSDAGNDPQGDSTDEDSALTGAMPTDVDRISTAFVAGVGFFAA